MLDVAKESPTYLTWMLKVCLVWFGCSPSAQTTVLPAGSKGQPAPAYIFIQNVGHELDSRLLVSRPCQLACQ